MRALLLAAALIALTPEAAAFDCAKAATRAETAICADEMLKAADDRLGLVYAALLKRTTQPDMAKLSQRAWLIARDRDCDHHDDTTYGKCLGDMTTARIDSLNARPLAGPGLTTSRLTPWFILRAPDAKTCAANLDSYLFGVAADTPGKRAYDASMTALIEDIDGKLGARPPELEAEITCDYESGTTLHYASDDLINATLYTTYYGGGAHGGFSATSIFADLKGGKVLAFDDIFPASAKKTFIDTCTAAIRAEKVSRLGSSAPRTQDDEDQLDAEMAIHADDIARVSTDLSQWAIAVDGVVVMFLPYQAGAYAEGTFECTLPTAMLQKAAGKRGWIVP